MDLISLTLPQEYIIGLFDAYIDPGLTFIKKQCSQAIEQVLTAQHIHTYRKIISSRILGKSD